MIDLQADEWAVAVPAARPKIADSLWREWSRSNVPSIDPKNVRVDLIRADGGDLRRYLVRGVAPLVSMTALAERLKRNCEGFRTLIDEHQADYGGETLGHLLVADVRRHLENQFQATGMAEQCGCLEVLAHGMDEGDAPVQNAIAVSFVEDARWWDPQAKEFIQTWPKSLQDEVERQRES